jgi:uncharacterized membrane protein YeaQ/YmgE (transglycosylase-associated protein family)
MSAEVDYDQRFRDPQTGKMLRYPAVLEPVPLILNIVLAVLGAIIGIHLITTLGITANTSVIGALVAMLVARVPLAQMRRFRSVHRQNLVQTSISGATFGAGNALLLPIAVPWALDRPDLVWPMLASGPPGSRLPRPSSLGTAAAGAPGCSPALESAALAAPPSASRCRRSGSPSSATSGHCRCSASAC